MPILGEAFGNSQVAAIAHDLRTPLSRIAFRAESLDEAIRDPIQRDVDQMKAMISATLDYSRSTNCVGRNHSVDLAALLSRLVDEERALGRKVELTGARVVAAVQGDEIELGRLLQNLIDNAHSFASDVEIGLLSDPQVVRVSIVDRGPGIAADKLEEVFSPFVRVEPSRNRNTGGVGLGLSIARDIARRHGGDLTLSNRAGGGLCAELSLPRSTE